MISEIAIKKIGPMAKSGFERANARHSLKNIEMAKSGFAMIKRCLYINMEKNKDFDKWNELKKKLQISEKLQNFYFREREIWWCSLGVNIGFEQDGKNDNFERPVLIIRIFNREVLWIVPLTSKRKNNKYYYDFDYKNKPQAAILSQVRLISSKRLLRKIWTFPINDFKKVKELISNFLK